MPFFLRQRLRYVWSMAFVLAMAIVGSLGPVIQAPRQSLSLGTPLGKALYASSLVALAIAVIVALVLENIGRTAEEAGRERRAMEKHDATVGEILASRDAAGQQFLDQLANQRVESDRVIAFLQQLMVAERAVERTGTVGLPLMTAIDEAGSFVTRLYADRQQRNVAAQVAAMGYSGSPLPTGPVLDEGPFPEANAVLKEISQNPPVTAAGVSEAAARLMTLAGVVITSKARVHVVLGKTTPSRPESGS